MGARNSARTSFRDATVLLAGVAVGTFVMHAKIFPYPLLAAAYQYVTPNEPDAEGLAALRADLPQTLRVRSPAAADDARRLLVDFIWGQAEPPYVLPSRVQRQWTGWPRIAAAARTDRLEIAQEFGVNSIAFHLVPKRPNGRLVIFHQGHEPQAVVPSIVSPLLEAGYSVVLLNMPLQAMNPQPLARLPGIGTVRLDSHQALSYARPKQGRPLRFFLDPVLAVLNYTAPDYRSVAMVGHSGGGWTTTIAAAIDPRIQLSMPIAGTSPISTWSDAGDYEQTVPSLYSQVSYLDLYAMGTTNGRRQVQILNRYDPCCFPGKVLDTYRADVAKAARSLGGTFDGLIANQRFHEVGGEAIDRVLVELDRRRANGGRYIAKMSDPPSGKAG